MTVMAICFLMSSIQKATSCVSSTERPEAGSSSRSRTGLDGERAPHLHGTLRTPLGKAGDVFVADLELQVEEIA